MRSSVLVVLAVVAASRAYVSRVQVRPRSGDHSEGSAGVGEGVAGLAATLHSAFPAGDYALLSPLSVATVLAALQMGARGPTAHQIAALLGQGSTSDRAYWTQLGDALRAINASANVVSSLANAIFMDKSLSLSVPYARDVQNYLASNAYALDIEGNPRAAADFVNRWVADKTHNKIRKIVDGALDPRGGLVVASALYFNGAWMEQFPINSTRRSRFTVSEKETIEVDMMEHESNVLYVRDSTLKCQVLGLPYKDPAFAMFLLLPEEPGVSGLSRLEAQLSPLAQLRLLASTEWTEIPYFVPRMHLEGYVTLRDPLASAGVSAIFDPEKADLSGMVNKRGKAPLFVGDMVHRVAVDVTESGTEAAAATVALITLHGRIEEFRANRPFLLSVQHRPTGVLLFSGRVVRPTPNYKPRVIY